MYCSKCNNSIPDSSRFCPICGSQLINTEENNVENNSNSYNTFHYSTKAYASFTDLVRGAKDIVKDNWKTIFLMIFTYLLISFVINLGVNFVKIGIIKNNFYGDSTASVVAGSLSNYTSSYISNDSSSSYSPQIPNNSLNSSSSYSGSSLDNYSDDYSSIDEPKAIFNNNNTKSSLGSLLLSRMGKSSFSASLVNLILSFLTILITLPLTYGLIAALTKVKRR